jgi:hypothetical protein
VRFGILESSSVKCKCVLRTVALVSHMRQDAEQPCAFDTRGARKIERLAKHTVRIGQCPRGGKHFAELSTENEDRLFGFVELTTKHFAAGKLETSPKRQNGPFPIASFARSVGHLFEQHERFERVLRVLRVKRSHLDRKWQGVAIAIDERPGMQFAPYGNGGRGQCNFTNHGMRCAETAEVLTDEAGVFEFREERRNILAVLQDAADIVEARVVTQHGDSLQHAPRFEWQSLDALRNEIGELQRWIGTAFQRNRNAWST